MIRRRFPLAARLCLSALPGMLAGHALVYQLLFPSDQHRHRYLELTGHGYLRWAVLAGIAGGAGAAVAALRAGWCAPRRRATPLRLLVVALGGIQVAAFTGLEVVERLAAGAPLGGVWLVVAVGLVVQLLVALVSGLALGGMERLGQALAPASDQRWPRAAAAVWPAAPARRRLAGIELPPLRAPPAPARP